VSATGTRAAARTAVRNCCAGGGDRIDRQPFTPQRHRAAGIGAPAQIDAHRDLSQGSAGMAVDQNRQPVGAWLR